MKLALVVYEERISVIFDNSSQLLIVSTKDNFINSKKRICFGTLCTVEMVNKLKNESVEVLICGGISEFMLRTIESNGIRVIPWISGSVNKVIEAWLNGKMEDLVMPGCRRF